MGPLFAFCACFNPLSPVFCADAEFFPFWASRPSNPRSAWLFFRPIKRAGELLLFLVQHLSIGIQTPIPALKPPTRINIFQFSDIIAVHQDNNSLLLELKPPFHIYHFPYKYHLIVHMFYPQKDHKQFLLHLS